MNLHQPADGQADKLTGDALTAERLAVEKFAVGQSVPRSEDPMLLRGAGRYTDDVSLPNQAYAVMVRSRVAHGGIGKIDVEAARQMQGVRSVIFAEDQHAAGIRNMPAASNKNQDVRPPVRRSVHSRCPVSATFSGRSPFLRQASGLLCWRLLISVAGLGVETGPGCCWPYRPNCAPRS